MNNVHKMSILFVIGANIHLKRNLGTERMCICGLLANFEVTETHL